MDLVSIIIPTFNSAKTVRSTLESVKNQVFQDWECVIVDGASNDKTLEIVNSYCESDARFHCYSEKDKGIYDAFNKGWKKAQGRWVHYLGSDDTLTSDGLAELSKHLDERYAIVTGDVNLIRSDGTIKQFVSDGFLCCHQGVLMQRKVLEELGGFDEQYRIIADHDLLARVEKAGYKVKNVRTVIANFSTDGASSRISYQYKILKETYQIDRKYGLVKHPLMNSMYIFIYKCLSGIYRKFKN